MDYAYATLSDNIMLPAKSTNRVVLEGDVPSHTNVMSVGEKLDLTHLYDLIST